MDDDFIETVNDVMAERIRTKAGRDPCRIAGGSNFTARLPKRNVRRGGADIPIAALVRLVLSDGKTEECAPIQTGMEWSGYVFNV